MERLAVRGEEDLDAGERDYLDGLDQFISLYDRDAFAQLSRGAPRRVAQAKRMKFIGLPNGNHSCPGLRDAARPRRVDFWILNRCASQRIPHKPDKRLKRHSPFDAAGGFLLWEKPFFLFFAIDSSDNDATTCRAGARTCRKSDRFQAIAR